MSVNVGSAHGNFELRGLSKAQEEVAELVNRLENLQLSYKKQRAESREMHQIMMQTSGAYRKFASDATYVQGGINRLNAALKRHASQWRDVTQAIQESQRARASRLKAQGQPGAGAGFSLGASSPTETINRVASDYKSALGGGAIAPRVDHRNYDWGSMTAGLNSYAKKVTEASLSTSRFNSVTSRMSKIVGSIKARLLGYAAATNKVERETKQATSQTNMLARAFQTTRRALRGLNSGADAWWKRFGMVAGGFWIAYRAINAIENAISVAARTFARGASLMDEYVETLSTVSGMLALTAKNNLGFSKTFDRVRMVMRDTMEEALRLAPVFRLSGEEIGTAFRELAQFGVVVTRDIAGKSLNAVAMIKEIAMTTGSSARQVRQEIQSLFTGTTRVTDQFGRMIKFAMPELADKLFGIAAATTTTDKKWRMLIDSVWEFREAVMEGNKTLRGQAEIAQNTLGVVSMRAIRASGIYEKWVDTMRNFNKRLISDNGQLGDYGKKAYEIFYRLWQILSRLVDVAISVGKSLAAMIDFLRSIYTSFTDVINATLRWVATLFILKTTLGLVVGVGNALLRLTGISAVATIVIGKFTKTVGAMGLGAALVHTSKSIVLFLSKVVLIPAIFVIAIRTIYSAFYGLMSVIGEFSLRIENFFQRIVDIKDALKDAWDNKSSFADMYDSLKGALLTPKAKTEVEKSGKELSWLFWEQWEEGGNKFDATLMKGLKDIGASIKGALLSIIGEEGRALIDQLSLTSDQVVKLFDFSDVMEEFKISAEEVNKILAGLGIARTHAAQGDGVQKKLDRWKKTLAELKYEFSNLGATQLEKDLNDIGRKFDKIFADAPDTISAETVQFLDEYRAKLEDIARINADLRKQARARVEIDQQLSDLQAKYNRYQIGTQDKLKEEIKLIRDKIASQKVAADLARTAGDYAAVQQALDSVKELNDELAETIYILSKFDLSPLEALALGFKRYKREVENLGVMWEQAGYDITSALQQTFSDGLFDWYKGELDSLEDYVRSFSESVLKIFNDMLAKIVAAAIAEKLGGLITGAVLGGMNSGGGGGSTPVTTDLVSSSGRGGYTKLPFAKGGIIPEHVVGMGLSSGNMYEFGEAGPERVLSNEDSFTKPSMNVQVNIINKSSNQVESTTQNSRFDGKKYVVDVILEDVTRGGKLRPLFRS